MTSPCGDGSTISIHSAIISPTMPTVGIIEWSLSGGAPTDARIIYSLTNPFPGILNRGGLAPVDLTKPAYRTLLLGLKQAKDYTFHIEATRNGVVCASAEYPLPTTGTFPDARPTSVTVAQPDKREPGFIVTSSGSTLPNRAFILDADGEIVWHAPAPENPSRAQMDYEGENMWMVSLNMINTGGEMRYVSMDGEREERNIPGLALAHHDFTVLPGGKIAALVWTSPAIDPESDLVIRSPDGNLARLFTVGANQYASEAFHANAIHYCPQDGGFTIADRNPNVVVKVGAAGAIEWQVGGECAGVPAGARCYPQSWQVVHGHHLLDNGSLLVFNNGFSGMARVYEFAMDASPASFAVTPVKDYQGTAASFNLGDVQRLPGGNTLITYATDEQIVEVDAEWNIVQTFSARVGYASWRPTLYGPPARP